MLLVGQQEGHPVCKKLGWGAGMVICLERGADLHMAQPMPLPLTVSCFSKIQIGFTFLVLAHLGSPGQSAIKWVCVCVIVCFVSFFLLPSAVFSLGINDNTILLPSLTFHQVCKWPFNRPGSRQRCHTYDSCPSLRWICITARQVQ